MSLFLDTSLNIYHSFQHVVSLVLENAMITNKPGTAIYKAAQRIKLTAEPVLDDLNKLVSS